MEPLKEAPTQTNREEEPPKKGAKKTKGVAAAGDVISLERQPTRSKAAKKSRKKAVPAEEFQIFGQNLSDFVNSQLSRPQIDISVSRMDFWLSMGDMESAKGSSEEVEYCMAENRLERESNRYDPELRRQAFDALVSLSRYYRSIGDMESTNASITELLALRAGN